nr:hypothetical protein CFP56_11692 [Quercus suber]
MSSTASRAFSSSSKKAALRWVGGSKSDILAHNPGNKGQKVVEGIDNVGAEAEKNVRDLDHVFVYVNN